MGAEQFTVFGEGSDVVSAFTNTVRQAQYDHGHSGYSGTIAEKESFVIISSNPMTYVEAEQLAERLIQGGDPRIDDKWGPAGAIRVQENSQQVNHYTGKEETVSYEGWLFFGWASS